MVIKRNAAEGVITFAVSCIMATLVLVGTIFVRSGTQMGDLALQRITYEQCFRACESLTQYGGWLIDTYRESLSALAIGTRINHSLSAWPMTDVNPHFEATIVIEIQEHHFMVTTALRAEETLTKRTFYSRG
jgi:hypothetical protein